MLRDSPNWIAGPRRTTPVVIAALTVSLLGAHLAGATGAAPAPVEHPNPCHIRRLHLRCPDLIMSEPSEMEMDRTTEPGRVLLRATSSVDNHGNGPMELRAKRTGKHRWRVYQAIYDRRGNVHLFRTKANLVFKFVPGERYGIGNLGDASYWKLQHAAGFQLWSINRHFKAIRLVRTGPKVDYCLRDLERTDPKPGSPPSAHYPACNQDPGLKHDRLGTSVGWSDIYPYSYPQQWIDVTGLHGRFAYVQIADPDHYFRESNHRNDLSETYIDLPSGRVIGHRTGVAGP